MARQQLPPPAGQQTTMKKQKKRSGFWARVKRSLVTSFWITWLWEWFLSLAGRLVQPALFVTVMYQAAETSPWFHSPGAWIDQSAFLLQNGALDIGSFGLPELAEQAEREGNQEGAEQARKIGRALFWILVSNLVWAGIEQLAGPAMPDWMKKSVALIFLVIRAYYALSYSKVVHALQGVQGQEEDGDEVQVQALVQVQEVQAESEQVQRLEVQVQALVQEVQTLVQVREGQGQGGATGEVQGQLTQVQDQIAEVQAQVQDQIAEVQAQVQGQLAEVQAYLTGVQGQLAEVQARRSPPTLVAALPPFLEVQGGASTLIAPGQVRVQGASEGANGQTDLGVNQPEVGAPVQEGARAEGQQATGEQMPLHSHDTEPLHLVQATEEQGGATPPGFRELIAAYVLHQVQTTGNDPSVKQIMEGVGCKERTAKSYRAAAIAQAHERLVALDV